MLLFGNRKKFENDRLERGNMKLGKTIGILMLLSVILLSGCASDASGPVTPPQTPELNRSSSGQAAEPLTNEILMGTSEDGMVKLYAIEKVKHGFEGVILEINGRQGEFDWSIPNTGTGTGPQVFNTDLTGDGQEEAVIIIQTGRGTGLDIYDIHVINANDLSEIKVQGYEDIVAQEIESHVVKNDDGTLGIIVKSQGEQYNFDHSFDPAPDYNQEELYFGGVMVYYLENHKIQLNLPGSIGISPAYVCDFTITYKFDRAANEFIADEIEVTPVK